MLRTIGFGRFSILASFLFESLLICGAGCLTGIAASFSFDGSRKDFLSDATWTVLAYELRITPEIVGAAIGVSLFVGLIGGMAPALRASRVKVIEALRKA
jgi:ABC-type antimicrobial peptide transport system permease subunit